MRGWVGQAARACRHKCPGLPVRGFFRSSNQSNQISQVVGPTGRAPVHSHQACFHKACSMLYGGLLEPDTEHVCTPDQDS